MRNALSQLTKANWSGGSPGWWSRRGQVQDLARSGSYRAPASRVISIESGEVFRWHRHDSETNAPAIVKLGHFDGR